jgi:hypothetical protein
MAEERRDDLLSTRLALPEPGSLPPMPSLRWRRKTDQEVLKEVRRAKLGPMPPLLVGTFAAVLVTVASLPDVRNHWQGDSLGEALAAFPLVFLVCFVGVYLLQLCINPLRYRTPMRVTICTRCHDISPNKGNDKCPCGGELDDADRWTHERASE